jgi:hypothetical protein
MMMGFPVTIVESEIIFNVISNKARSSQGIAQVKQSFGYSLGCFIYRIAISLKYIDLVMQFLDEIHLLVPVKPIII